MLPGLFVTIEGCEGAGKSTQCRLLALALGRNGHQTYTAREPGGTPVSEKIRAILLDPGNGEITARVELLLYLASRAQLVHQVILPALEQGKVVVSDRFHHSTLAYQGGARGLGLEEVELINSFATEGLLPDITFLLDLPPEDGFLRKQGTASDRMEGAGMEFHRRVRDTFLELAGREGERIVVLDAREPVEKIAEQIESRVCQLLEQRA